MIAFGERARDDDGGSFGAPAGGFGGGAGEPSRQGEAVRPTRAPQPTPDDLDDLPF